MYCELKIYFLCSRREEDFSDIRLKYSYWNILPQKNILIECESIELIFLNINTNRDKFDELVD